MMMKIKMTIIATAVTMAAALTACTTSVSAVANRDTTVNNNNLTVENGKDITIDTAGKYVLTGKADGASVIIDASDEDNVELVLDGLVITNKDKPCIYVRNADKVSVTLSGDNSLSVTGEFGSDGDTNTDAVIFSKADIVFNGKGTLTINSAEGNGISGKDDVRFTGGSYSVTSAKDAVEAKDSLAICGGSFTISSEKDGFHSAVCWLPEF